ncbi:hypothetical protein Ocin01_20078, partial [Orchesella cincta]
MNVSSCILCFKTIDEVNSTSEESGEVPLLTKFLKFVQNYLQVDQLPSSEQLLGMCGGDGKELFCEKCELSVITPICQVYSQLLATQLRLSWELGQLEKLLVNSQSSTKLDSIGIINNKQLKNFRRSLTENCRLKRKEMMPQVVLQRLTNLPTTRPALSQPVVKIENELYEDHDNDDDGDFNALDVDSSNSLHSQGFENATSSDGSNQGGDLEMDAENTTVKIEIVQDSQQFFAKSDDEDDEKDLDPNCSPAVEKPKKRSSDSEQNQFHCPKCPK